MAASVSKAVATGKSCNLEIDFPYLKQGGQTLDPVMLTFIADSGIQFSDGDDRDRRERRQAVDHLNGRVSIAQIVD